MDADSPDGPWVLVAYGNNGALPARLDVGGGVYDSTRQGSASINALEFIKNSSKMAISWSRTGLPSGGITSYDHAVSFAFPNPQNLTLTTEQIPASGGSTTTWSRVSTHPSTVELDLQVLHGAPELPSKMFARAETFGARYGNYYGFAWFPEGKFAHNQLDWGPDSQEINALYLGANGQPGYVAPGAGGTQNGYTPSTMAIWARLPVEGEVIAETPGNAFYFDGQTYINIPDNNTLDLVSDYTIEAWVNVIDTANNTIIDKGDYRYLFQTHPNGNAGLGLFRKGGWIYSQGSIPINEWVHVAVSVATDGTVKFYKNGQLLSSHSGPFITPDSGPVNIGRQSPNTCACNLANGSFDEIRIWNSARSDEDIFANYNKILTGGTEGFLAYWKFKKMRECGRRSSNKTTVPLWAPHMVGIPNPNRCPYFR